MDVNYYKYGKKQIFKFYFPRSRCRWVLLALHWKKEMFRNIYYVNNNCSDFRILLILQLSLHIKVIFTYPNYLWFRLRVSCIYWKSLTRDSFVHQIAKTHAIRRPTVIRTFSPNANWDSNLGISKIVTNWLFLLDIELLNNTHLKCKNCLKTYICSFLIKRYISFFIDFVIYEQEKCQ